jgi:hypothetical protein
MAECITGTIAADCSYSFVPYLGYVINLGNGFDIWYSQGAIPVDWGIPVKEYHHKNATTLLALGLVSSLLFVGKARSLP